MLFFELTGVGVRAIEIIAKHQFACYGRVGQVGTLYDSRVGCGVEFVELVPADKIPVADIVIHDKLATTAATDLPYQRAYAHIVLGIIHILKPSHIEIGSIDTGTLPQRFDILLYIGIGKSTEFGLGLHDSEPDGHPRKEERRYSSYWPR